MIEHCRICKSHCHSTATHAGKVAKTAFESGGVPWNKGKKGLQVSWIKGLTKATDSRVRQISESLAGKPKPWTSLWNSLYKGGGSCSEEHKRKLSKTMKLARRSYAPIWNKGLTKKDHPSLRSMARKLAIRMTGVPNPGAVRNGWRRFWYSGHGTRIKMRSRWEVAYAKWLDTQGIDWLYEHCTFTMDAFSYTPDFYVRGNGVEPHFVEIKGYIDDVYARKFERFVLHFGTRIELVMLPELVKLGVLDKHGRVVMPNVCRES